MMFNTTKYSWSLVSLAITYAVSESGQKTNVDLRVPLEYESISAPLKMSYACSETPIMRTYNITPSMELLFEGLQVGCLSS